MADAEQTLLELLNTILDEKNYKPREINVETISSGGANFTSAIFLATVTSPGRDDLNLFAKVAIIGHNMRKRMHADWLFDTERFVYTKLAKIYNDIQDKHNLPLEHRFVFPKFYGHNAEFGKETIVLENLVENGYKPYNRFKSTDWEHASVVIDNLAKFHALSFAFAEDDPEEFERLAANMKFRIGSQPEEKEDETLKALWMKMVERSVEHVDEDEKIAVLNYMKQLPRWNEYYKPIGKAVIAHGDYRMSNILFRKQEDKLEAITLDFQTVHAGCPVTDLIYFIFLGSDKEFRDEYYDKLLDHYYVSLEKAFKRLSINAEEVYPRSKFESDMKESLPLAVLLAVGLLPIVTIEAESAPRVDKDADVKDFIITPSELFAERFKGVIKDCIRLGAI